MFWCKPANKKKHVSEHSWLSGWVIFSILAHSAHLIQSDLSLVFSAINKYDCSWFDPLNEQISVTERKNLMRSDQLLQLFSTCRHYLLVCTITYWLLSFKYRLVPIHGSVDPQWLLVRSDRVAKIWKCGFMMLQLWLSLCVNKHGVGKDINGTYVPLPTCWPRFCKPTCYVTTSRFFSQLVHLSQFFLFSFSRFLASLLQPKDLE